MNNRGVSNGSISDRGVGNRGVSNGGVNNRGVINRTCDFASGSFFGHRFFCHHGLDTLGVIRKCSKRFTTQLSRTSQSHHKIGAERHNVRGCRGASGNSSKQLETAGARSSRIKSLAETTTRPHGHLSQNGYGCCLAVIRMLSSGGGSRGVINRTYD